MEIELNNLIMKYYDDENTQKFIYDVKRMLGEKGVSLSYYVENREVHEIFFDDKKLSGYIESRKEKERILKHEKERIYYFNIEATSLVFKTEGWISGLEDEIRFISQAINKVYELKFYRINSFVSPFFYEITKIFYPNSDVTIALDSFVQIFDDIFGIRIMRIEKNGRVFFYRENKDEKNINYEYKDMTVYYIVVRNIDKSIEIEKVFKVSFFILDIFLESKLLEERQKEFLEYQILSKENLTKLNRLLEKSLYKMTFISNLYKKLSQVREIKEALEIVQKFLKNEVGYDYLKVECGSIKTEDGVFSEKYKSDIFEGTLMENSVVFRISLYKTEITSEDNVYIGLIFNNSKVEIENILLYKRVEEMAIIDGVTQLYLHRYFVETLDKEVSLAVRYQRDVSLIMCDIDNFKHFNDTYGHLEGDRVLYNTAAVIKESIRKVDIACRYGGEEFIVILPHTGIENAEILAERLRKNIEDKTAVTVSVGVVEFNFSESRDEFIKRADKAMYSAKQNGKNRVVRG